MPTRQINSPGVEIRELDRSQVAPQIVGTSVLVAGHTARGEVYEPVDIVSVTDLETNFGVPTNAAERYFYHACKDVILENGNLLAAKLPYSNTMDTNYKYIPVNVDTAGTTDYNGLLSALPSISGALDGLSGSSTITDYTEFTVGTPTDITTSDYDVLVAGGAYVAEPAEFIIVNERKSTVEGPNLDQGVFVTIVDSIHGMLAQRVLSESDNDIMDLVTAGELSGSTFVPNLTGTYRGSSVSEDVARFFPAVTFTDGGDDLSPDYNNWVTVIVASTVANENTQGNLDVSYQEAWSGSLRSDAVDPATGRSAYIGDLINQNSNWIRWFATNPTVTQPLALGENEAVFTTTQGIELMSFTEAEAAKDINGADLIDNLEKVFEKVSNIEERQLDVILDAGLSTIAQTIGTTTSEFEPINSGAGEITSSSDTAIWRTVASSIDNFCKNIRKDCMGVIDAPRNLVLEGDEKLIRKTAPDNTFGNTISPALKYITGLNSSYTALYSNWVRVFDEESGLNVWLPPSVKVGGIYVRNDRVANIWDAPAGLNRGIMTNISDIAFNPIVKEADQVYTKSINYAKFNTLDGFSLEGQKTTQARPSAFDRVNVRRLFLRLERVTYQLARYFVYEPNNLFTRRRLVSTLEPLFQSVKAQGGLFDYKIICDETNNTPEVIDANELKITILLKPVRTAEFILVDFVATRTDANFDELV
jgi:hypothetical protein